MTGKAQLASANPHISRRPAAISIAPHMSREAPRRAGENDAA